MSARFGQLFWLAVVCGVVWGGVYVGLSDAKAANWAAGVLFAVFGLVILIRPFRRDDWEEFWEKLGEWCWWW